MYKLFFNDAEGTRNKIIVQSIFNTRGGDTVHAEAVTKDLQKQLKNDKATAFIYTNRYRAGGRSSDYPVFSKYYEADTVGVILPLNLLRKKGEMKKRFIDPGHEHASLFSARSLPVTPSQLPSTLNDSFEELIDIPHGSPRIVLYGGCSEKEAREYMKPAMGGKKEKTKNVFYFLPFDFCCIDKEKGMEAVSKFIIDHILSSEFVPKEREKEEKSPSDSSSPSLLSKLFSFASSIF